MIQDDIENFLRDGKALDEISQTQRDHGVYIEQIGEDLNLVANRVRQLENLLCRVNGIEQRLEHHGIGYMPKGPPRHGMSEPAGVFVPDTDDDIENAFARLWAIRNEISNLDLGLSHMGLRLEKWASDLARGFNQMSQAIEKLREREEMRLNGVKITHDERLNLLDSVRCKLRPLPVILQGLSTEFTRESDCWTACVKITFGISSIHMEMDVAIYDNGEVFCGGSKSVDDIAKVILEKLSALSLTKTP